MSAPAPVDFFEDSDEDDFLPPPDHAPPPVPPTELKQQETDTTQQRTHLSPPLDPLKTDQTRATISTPTSTAAETGEERAEQPSEQRLPQPQKQKRIPPIPTKPKPKSLKIKSVINIAPINPRVASHQSEMPSASTESSSKERQQQPPPVPQNPLPPVPSLKPALKTTESTLILPRSHEASPEKSTQGPSISANQNQNQMMDPPNSLVQGHSVSPSAIHRSTNPFEDDEEPPMQNDAPVDKTHIKSMSSDDFEKTVFLPPQQQAAASGPLSKNVVVISAKAQKVGRAKKMNAIKEGFLEKEGHVVLNWKKRWFVLTATGIEYYEKPTSAKPKGTIDFTTGFIKVEEWIDKVEKRKYCMKLFLKEKDFVVDCKNNTELQGWMKAIREISNFYQ